MAATTNSPSSPTNVKWFAVVCDSRGPDATRMKTYVETQVGDVNATAATTMRWYALRDMDKVNGDVLAGRVDRVVFVRPADLLDGIFNNEIKYSDWISANILVVFLDLPSNNTNNAAPSMADIGKAWDRYQQTRRRRQTIAGVILGAIAIAAAFVVTSIRMPK
ncbi:MAG: hypothetical protein FWC56_01595 [Phycisphaerae bacterium]|nr:hypothetical protein [Phycisphaerae bacterium]